MKKVELLAPAGSKEALIAAIQNNADAVYLGWKQFGARAYANNFATEELIELVKYAHLYDKKVYVTVNTIVYENEIKDLIDFLDFLYLSDVDAIIIQDLGVLNIVRNRYPDFELHASTQMNIKSLEEAKVLKDLGFTRIVLARETPIEEIIRIKNNLDIELEVFVHGALCVSYSGNCYMSSLIGKRSGNRGRCAQPCRLPYKLDDGEEKYLISPKDLLTLEYIDKLIEAGVDSLKIEGRMKRSEYVAGVVKIYRNAINCYYQKTKFDIDNAIYDLRLLFNREFTKGFIFGENNNDFANIESSNHIGVLIGKVIKSKGNIATILLEDNLSKDDGIRIVGNVTDGITVNQIYKNNQLLTNAKSGDIVNIRCHVNINPGAFVYKTTSSNQIQELQATYDKDYLKINIKANIKLINNKLVFEITDGNNIVSVESNEVLDGNNDDFINRIISQLSKINNSPFEIVEFTNEINRSIFLPIKDINELRRNAVTRLIELRGIKHTKREILNQNFNSTKVERSPLTLKARVKNEEQLNAAIKAGIKDIYVDSALLYRNNLNKYDNVNIYYYASRVDYNSNFENLVTSSLANVKDNNTSIYMNITNSLSLNELSNLGAKTIGISLELSKDQINDLISSYINSFDNLPNLEMLVYGRYELMIMKYCLINKYYDEKNMHCNRCVKNQNYLTDRKGVNYPLIKDKYCNLMILNDSPTNLLEYLNEIISMGINNLLLDFSIEKEEEVYNISRVYLDFIKGIKNKLNLTSETLGHYKEGVL